MRRTGCCGPILLALLIAVPALAEEGSTLAEVREHEALRCGIDRSQAEYSSTEEHGSRIEFDRGICEAVAVAALGVKGRVLVTLYADGATALRALAQGRADVVPSVSADRRLLEERERDAVAFSRPILRDPVSIMVLRSDRIATAAQLSGQLVCVLSETRAQEAVQSWFAQKKLDFLPFPFQEEGEMEAAFVTHRCRGLAGDRTRLLETRHDTGSLANGYEILPDEMGEDSLSTAYRSGDTEWGELISAVEDLLVAADTTESGSAATTAARSAEKKRMQNVVRPERELLDPDWAQAVLSVVGSYKDLVDRSFNSNLGCDPLRIDEPEGCAR